MKSIQNNSSIFSATPFLTSLFCMYLIFCFFEPYFNTIIGNIGKYVIFIIILSFLISYKSITIKWYHFCIMLWFVLKIISIFWASFNQIVSQHFISQIGMVALFITMTIVSFDLKFVTQLIHSMMYSSFLLGILCLFFSQPYREVTTRQVLTIQGAQMDPNNQSAFLLIGVSISLYFLLNKKIKMIYNILLIGFLLINAYAMFLTGSRGGIASIILILLLLTLFSEKGVTLISRQTIINCIIILIVIIITYFLARNFLAEDIFNRLFDFSTYEGGSKRVTIWGNAAQIFFDNPLIGGGWGSYWGYNGYYVVIHNTFLSILVDGGLIGITLFLLPVIYIVISSLKQHNILPILILISGLAPSFFIDAINKRFFWNAIIVSMILVITHSRVSTKTLI